MTLTSIFLSLGSRANFKPFKHKIKGTYIWNNSVQSHYSYITGRYNTSNSLIILTPSPSLSLLGMPTILSVGPFSHQETGSLILMNIHAAVGQPLLTAHQRIRRQVKFFCINVEPSFLCPCISLPQFGKYEVQAPARFKSAAKFTKRGRPEPRRHGYCRFCYKVRQSSVRVTRV